MIRFKYFICISYCLLFACKKEISEAEQNKKDDVIIQQYIQDNNLEAIKTPKGNYVIMETIGVGDQPKSTDQISVIYKGMLLDGIIFDSSNEQAVSFSLTSLIVGWQETLPFFRESGKGKIILLSRQAYGSNPPQGIPKDAVLIFEIELLSIL